MTLEELKLDPAFRRLPYAEQQKERMRLVVQDIESNPNTAQAPSSVKLQVLRDVANLPPVLSQEFIEQHGTIIDEELRVAAAAQAGDPQAISRAQSDAMAIEYFRNNGLALAMIGVSSAIEKVFGQESPTPGFYSNPDVEKLRHVLEQSVGAPTWKINPAMAGAMLGQTVEFVALNSLLIGTLSAPGLLTKGAFEKAAARMTARSLGVTATGTVEKVNRGSRLLWKSVMPFIVEKGTEGLFDSSVDLAEAFINGDIRVPKDAFTNFAKGFGEGVMVDLVTSMAGSVIKKVGGAVRKTYMNHDWAGGNLDKDLPFREGGGVGPISPEIIERYLGGTIDESYLQALPKAEAERLIAGARDLHTKLANAGVIGDPRSPDGFALLAKSQGFDAQVLPTGKVKITDYLFQTKKFPEVETPDLASAERWMHDYRIRVGQEVAAERSAKAIMAMSKSVRVSRLLSTEVDPTGVAREELARAIQPVGGTVNPSSTLAFGRAFLKAGGADETAITSLRVRVADDFYTIGDVPKLGELVVPKTVVNAVQEQKWLESLEKQLRVQIPEGKIPKSGTALFQAIQQQAEASPLTHTTLGLLVQGRLGGTFEDVGSSFKVSLPDGVAGTFGTLEEASRWTGRQLVERGLVTDEELAALFKRNTGLWLSIVERPDLGPGVKQYTPTFGGHKQNPGDVFDLDGLLKRYPQALSALPESLAPKTWFVGNRIVQQGDAIVGDVASLREYMSIFSHTRATETLEVTAAGSQILKVPMQQSYLVEDAVSGLRAEFPTYRQAQGFLRKIEKGGVNLNRIANQKGYLLSTGANGDFFLVAKGRPAKSYRTLQGVRNFLASIPDPESMPGIEGADDPFAETVAGQARLRFCTDSVADLYKGPDVNPRVAKRLHDPQGPHPVTDMVEQEMKDVQGLTAGELIGRAVGEARTALEPARDSIIRQAEKYGVPQVGEVVEQLGMLQKGVASSTSRAIQLIRRVFQKPGALGPRTLSRAALEKYAVLMEYPEHLWPRLAEAHEFKIEPGDKEIIDNAHQVLDALADIFGIKENIRIFNYAPRIREVWKEMVANPDRLVGLTKDKFLAACFGKSVPKEVQFFAESMRLDALVEMLTKRNLLDQMTYYAHEGYRKMYLGNFWTNRVAKLQKDMHGKIPAPVLKQFEEFFRTSLGITGSTGDIIQRNVSLNLTMALSRIMQKAPSTAKWGRFLQRNAEAVITNDLTGRLSHRQTMGMLAFRPWRGLANLGQYNNVYALYGSRAYDSFEAVDDAYIKHAYDVGLVTDNMFSGKPQIETMWTRLENLGLRPQENSEILTRVATAKTVDSAFTEAYDAYAKGAIDLKEFYRETRADLLYETQQKVFQGLLQQGNNAGAKRYLQEAIIRETMGDYTREGAPRAFKGWLGRLAGKFGVYSVSHANFVAKMASSGDWIDRVGTLGRFALSSVATYEAFRALGVDYHGFLFTDPYEFQGGPSLTMLLDLPGSVKAVGAMATGTTPNGLDSMHLGNLAGTAFASLVPGALEMKSIAKSLEYFQNGQVLEGAWAALGATPEENNLFSGNYSIFEGASWNQ